MIWALIIAIAAGVITALSLALALAERNRFILGLEHARKQEAANLAAAEMALRLSEAARADELRRLEGVIASLTNDIHSLEADLEACSSPASVRDRLRQLLAVAKTGDAAGVPPAGPVPG